MNKERGRSPMQLEQCCAQTEHMLNGTQARLLDLVLINRNSEVTFRRLLDALDTLKTETQWVPECWLD